MARARSRAPRPARTLGPLPRRDRRALHRRHPLEVGRLRPRGERTPRGRAPCPRRHRRTLRAAERRLGRVRLRRLSSAAEPPPLHGPRRPSRGGRARRDGHPLRSLRDTASSGRERGRNGGPRHLAPAPRSGESRRCAGASLRVRRLQHLAAPAVLPDGHLLARARRRLRRREHPGRG